MFSILIRVIILVCTNGVFFDGINSLRGCCKIKKAMVKLSDAKLKITFWCHFNYF